MKEKNIHWFPGHMKKALNEIEERIKLIDVVIEILDARAPLASMNPFLEERITNKPHLMVISKSDLADPIENDKWLSYFKSKGYAVIIGDLKDRSIIKMISKELVGLSGAKREKEARRGMKPQPIKSMIVGIPNVGKSTLINKIAKRPSAGVENRPGFTKAEQWIKVDKDFMLLDTPGVLPMHYESEEEAAKLALIGSIREDILPYDILVSNLLVFLRKYYPNSLKERFGISELKDDDSVIKDICIKRGLLSSGQLDFQRGKVLLVKEYKDGLLGRMSLERV